MDAETTPAPRKPWKNLGVRFASALILFLICVAPFYFGGWLWAAFVVLFSARMSYEWVRMSDKNPTRIAYLFPVLAMAIGGIYAVQGLWVYAGLTVIIAAILGLADRMRRGGGLWAGLGLLYILIPGLTIIGLRGNAVGFDTAGFQTLLYIILIVVAADVGAYFGGSYFQGPKLSPKLSPNKTWSGFFSGLIFAIIIGGIVTNFEFSSFWHGVLMGIPVVLLSVAGDLLESGLKRKLQVKDTGDLIPGHGGLLDRFDSLMMAAVGFTLIIWLFPAAWPL
ncbi:phosphatidate cytidylyltransferase [Litorimonas taeanensis]|uniref:Phosphatidate cytidylyltransferase n=1 Tax=Litorimonas taeanensis TaxID=568099 RepID=A0A420WKR0_9PROT|nr:phosphatidate cytidylyltransferase [Litorimonas taeanensis]RKQ71631.1 phosphatidate cytidylyltransferase [Litorimonas taeanensis]